MFGRRGRSGNRGHHACEIWATVDICCISGDHSGDGSVGWDGMGLGKEMAKCEGSEGQGENEGVAEEGIDRKIKEEEQGPVDGGGRIRKHGEGQRWPA